MISPLHLPAYNHSSSHKEKGKAVKCAEEKHRCEHHKMSPVVNSAINAAAVFHTESLKWAENQYADIVADEEKA